MEEKIYKSFHKIELLAPAKDINCAITAINCGADAVYIGASQFGARKKAGNSIEDIQKIVEYAHIFNVKVYVTVNTVLFDNELKEVEKLINDLYKIGVDALIIQDLGILKMNLPPIELHASTQCHNLSIRKIKFLESLNISRVVLPRELSLQEIKEIRENTGLELEFFIHGALCVSYSGQCYLSQSIGGRSANRGECAQPCRNRYSLIDDAGKFIIKDKYLLSLKDLCLIDNLKSLIDSGVKSLKIEGRLKDEDYIKTVVSAYRQKLDKLVDKTSDGIILSDFEPNLSKVFNRGFTQYNIQKSDINSIDTPKNRGEFIGFVKTAFVGGVEIKATKKINLNDGLCAFVDNELKGSTVTKVSGEKVYLLNTLNVKTGDKIYRNLDFEYQKYAKDVKIERKLEIKIQIDLQENELNFIFKCGENCVNTIIENNFEPAQNKEKSLDNIKKQFGKLGDTVFIAKDIEINFDKEIPFIPVSKLNEIRRNLADELKTKILSNYKANKRNVDYNTAEFPKTIQNDYKLNITNQKACEIYQEAGIDTPQKGFEVSQHIKNGVLMQTKNCMRKLAGICLKDEKCKNKNLYLLDSFGNKYPLKFNCKNCVMEILDYE